MTVLDVPVQSRSDLQSCIAKAISKVSAKKEGELCRYIPGDDGRLHHFTFKKMKKTEPEALQKMIEEHILEREPMSIASKPRLKGEARGKSTAPKLKRAHFKRLVDILKNSGDEELLSMFQPVQTLKQVQKEMIGMIKKKEIDVELWATYTKMVEEETALSSKV